MQFSLSLNPQKLLFFVRPSLKANTLVHIELLQYIAVAVRTKTTTTTTSTTTANF
jgi:hypothetical protein